MDVPGVNLSAERLYIISMVVEELLYMLSGKVCVAGAEIRGIHLINITAAKEFLLVMIGIHSQHFVIG